MDTSKRLLSLDALRGFDMLIIMGVAALIEAFCQAIPGGTETALFRNMQHAWWDGFTFMDTIFPLFLFIAGISFPFSYASQVSRGRSKWQIYRKILLRGVILVVLGILLNGLLKFDFEHLRIYSVLGRIGIAWMVAAILYVSCSRRWRVVITVAILLGYWALLALVPAPDSTAGPLTQDGNIVGYVDRVLGLGVLYRGNFDPEGVLSHIPAVATAMLGMFTGEFIRSEKFNGGRKVAYMLAAAAVCLGLGLLWNIWFPVNKNLWSSSFVLVCAAYSLAMFSLFYWFIDVKGHKKWTIIFTVAGMNAITIYVACHIIDFWGIGSWFVGGLAGLMGAWGGVLTAAAHLAVVWLFLYFLYKQKIFLKI